MVKQGESRSMVFFAGAAILAVWVLLAAPGSRSPVLAEGDLNGDGIAEEYHLARHRLVVGQGGQEFWRSPSDWHIDSFALGDVDNDGTLNLVMTLWKTGSFGEAKPLWLTGEDTSYKNHLFVFKLQGSTMKSVWCSSDLDCPIVSFTIRDVDGDGLNELVVEEGRYRQVAKDRYALDTGAPLRTAVWQWDEWGFSLSNNE